MWMRWLNFYKIQSKLMYFWKARLWTLMIKDQKNLIIFSTCENVGRKGWNKKKKEENQMMIMLNFPFFISILWRFPFLQICKSWAKLFTQTCISCYEQTNIFLLHIFYFLQLALFLHDCCKNDWKRGRKLKLNFDLNM